MGDINVDIFLETLKQLITSSNLDFIIDMKDQLQSLEIEIKYLRKFLKITEKKRNEYSEVMKVVIQIRDVVYEAENIVELFVVLVFKADYTSDSLHEHQDHIESVIKKIKTLMDEVNHIYKENMYDLNGVAVKKIKHSSTKSGGGSSSLGGRNTSKVVEENVVVGFKDEVKTLMAKLHDSGELGELEIISIVGAGGGGKTTLAREVYNHSYTSEKFDIRAWVNVSQDYNKTMKSDLLISILQSAFQEKSHHGDEDQLGEKVYKCLQDRKYLIVMDDIWSLEAWNDIQRSFPRKGKRSKLLLTSRLPIQPNGIHCVHHSLDLLPKSYSWELLQKKVFKKKQCPPELVDIGKQIAEKCEGLPLAIVAIAGILATKDRTINVWRKVVKQLSSTIAKNQEGYMEILELSYYHLPLHLKACFLYIGGHPEDYEIRIRELIWLWIAEGFIQQSEAGKSLEAVANDYLKGLIDRNLVMVAKKSKSHGGIKECRIHDLLRELCLKKAKEDNFLVQIFRDDYVSRSTTNKHRRLFIGPQFFHKFSPRPHARNLRSFLHFKNYGDQSMSFFVKNFKLLRVLMLLSDIIPGKIQKGDLVHLRYLHISIHKSGRDRVQWYLDYFPNLEIFQVSTFRNEISLPRNIYTGKMVKLRHLYINEWGIFHFHDVSDDEDRGTMLDSLQTVRRMCSCEHCLHFLERTPNLRKLGLVKRRGDFMLLDLEFLKCLEKLNIYSLARANNGLKLPSTLTRLTLGSTYLKWEELSTILQTLPCLVVLKIAWDACVGPIWDTSELEKGFSQLKYLELQGLQIEEWKVEDQFPRLEVLVIDGCRKLERIPIEFADSYELREIELINCCESLEESAIEIQEKQRDTKGDDCLKLRTVKMKYHSEGLLQRQRVINIRT